VADGSYKTPYGTAAFTLLPTLDATTDITLVNQTPGRHTDQNAYRAEAAGIYGCLAFTNELLAQHQLTNGSITMACDCKSALLHIFEHDYDKPAQAHYYIIHAYRQLRHQSPIQWTSRHVYGHQDDDKAQADLDRWEQINVDMDAAAKLHWLTAHNTNRPHFDLPHHDS
jgi:hypothetical protein